MTNEEKVKMFIAAREATGLSYIGFGKLIGRSNVAVCYYETGRRNIPLHILDKALKISKEMEDRVKESYHQIGGNND